MIASKGENSDFLSKEKYNGNSFEGGILPLNESSAIDGGSEQDQRETTRRVLSGNRRPIGRAGVGEWGGGGQTHVSSSVSSVSMSWSFFRFRYV